MLRIHPGKDTLGLEIWKLEYLDQINKAWLEVQTFAIYENAVEALEFELKHFASDYKWYAKGRKEQ